MADGLATACMVMGKKKQLNFFGFILNLRLFWSILIETGNFKTWASDKIEELSFRI
jgi:thiamine biosynthesis lipoprotein ApbE